MKPYAKATAAFVLTLLLALGGIAAVPELQPIRAEGEIIISQNGTAWVCDAPPYAVSGEVYAPLRQLAENLAIYVDYQINAGRITLTKGSSTIVLYLNHNIVTVNGCSIVIPAPPVKYDTVLTAIFLPVQLIARHTGYTCVWDGSNLTLEDYHGTGSTNISGYAIYDDGQPGRMAVVDLYNGSTVPYASKITSVSGLYTFTVQPGEYTIKTGKIRYYLRDSTSVVTAVENTSVSAPNLQPVFGDLNDDGVIDIYDLVALALKYGKVDK